MISAAKEKPRDPGFLALQKEPARNKRQKNALLLRNFLELF